jgi:hypothetical protein
MRQTHRGLQVGAQVRTLGMGARGTGRISREPDGSGYVELRSFAYGGTYLVPVARVRLVRPPRLPRA